MNCTARTLGKHCYRRMRLKTCSSLYTRMKICIFTFTETITQSFTTLTRLPSYPLDLPIPRKACQTVGVKQCSSAWRLNTSASTSSLSTGNQLNYAHHEIDRPAQRCPTRSILCCRRYSTSLPSAPFSYFVTKSHIQYEVKLAPSLY
jgi:hypothetical protein